ncbi:MAG: DUF3422 family protein [Alphaproteobacteria bacterium]
MNQSVKISSPSPHPPSLHDLADRRHQANRELHARPFADVALPARILHTAFAVEPDQRAAFCTALAGLAPMDTAPTPDDVHFSTQANGVGLRTEFHTEFATVTLIAPLDNKDHPLAFAQLQTLPGENLVAAECICAHDADIISLDADCVSVIGDGRATLAANFDIGEDGLTHLALAFENGTNPRAIGRSIQQVLEIETYRTLAAFGLPMARAMQKQLTQIADDLPDESESAAETFTHLTTHAEALDKLWRQTNYRFAASRAYYGIVAERLEELREERLAGRQRVGDFLHRRVDPALATCQAAEERRHALAEQVTSRANLLRTRIELDLQEQNRDLLTAISDGADRRLKLQQAVEGLSIAAITYYVIGLIAYPLTAFHGVIEDVGLTPELVKAAAIPVVLALVWLSVHRVKRGLLPAISDHSTTD